MASSLVSNPQPSSDRFMDSKRKKKRKTQKKQQQQQQHGKRWNTPDEHKNYSSKLLDAIRRVRDNPTPSAVPAGRTVREAADRALAVAAKGRTRWSRAILTNRLKLKFRKKRKAKVVVAAGGSGGGGNYRKKPAVKILKFKSKKFPAVQKRIHVLGKLVPGCQKLSFPTLLEETTDYIAALEMQVRTMTALTDLLSVGGTSSETLDSNPVS